MFEIHGPAKVTGGASVLDGLVANAAWPRRAGDPREFAEIVLSVVRDRMVNGETIRLDGGMRMPAL